MHVEHVPAVIVFAGDNGAHIIIFGLTNVAPGFFGHLPIHGIFTLRVFKPDRLDICCPTFFQPDVGKIVCNHSIPEIRVRHFMDVNKVHNVLPFSGHILIKHEFIIPGHQRDVFHCSANFPTGNLKIFWIWKGHPQLFLHPDQHFPRGCECALKLFWRIRFIGKISDGNVSQGFICKGRELANCKTG